MDFTDLGSSMQIADLHKDVEKLKMSAAKAARIEEIFRKIEFLYDREMKRASADYQVQMQEEARERYRKNGSGGF